jgi:hypothetical protein
MALRDCPRRLLGSREGQVLAALIVVGLALRVLATLAVWPIGLGIDDGAPYTMAAAHNPLSDVQAPAGYPAFLAALGAITRQVAAVAIVQHLLGIAAAIVFFAAVRRASGSAWLALIPAAGLLLDSDQIYLEHSVMAEGAFAIMLAATLYAAVRVLERPQSIGWAVATGALAGVDGLVRSAAVALVAVLVVATLLAGGAWRIRARAAGIVAGAAVVVLAAYALANLASNGELTVGPKPGWHLYGMVAHYADCRAFTPPAGTRRLCETTPPRRRQGLNFYLYDARSPARRSFGYFGHDATVGAFARQVVLHQPGAYLRNVALNFAGYFVPSVYPAYYGDPLGGQGLSPPLDWTRDNPDAARLAQVMQTFYAKFHQRVRPALRRALNDWAQVFRFGATLLTITTILSIAGLLVPGRRALIVLFGGAGLSLLLAPSVIGEYSGRYTLPLIAPMLASAAIAGQALWQWSQQRRRHSRLTPVGSE